MEPLLLLLLISFPLLLLLLKTLEKHSGDRRKNLPPGPWRLPIIGNLHQLTSTHHLSFLNLSQKHGPIMFLRLGSIPTLIISSGETLKTIFKSHDLNFSGRPTSRAVKKLSYNNSHISFAPHGDAWRRSRKICATELLSPGRVRSFRSVREEEVAGLCAAVEELSPAVNLSEMVFALSYNVVCRTVFGGGGGGGAYRGERSWFREAMAATQAVVAEFCVGDWMPGWGWIDGVRGYGGRLERSFEMVNGIYERVVEEHLRRRRPEAAAAGIAGDSREEKEEDLVDVLLRLYGEEDGDGLGFSDGMNFVKGIMGDMFFGGIDTTSATTIWAMTELMKNPKVMAKLKQELEDVIGNKRKVEETDLQELQYLKLVIKETLRLHPPAPLLVPRETLEPCKIDGYDIPSKTLVFINAYAIARDPKIWKNHDEFRPERFDLVGVDLKGQDFDYVPFGIGRRICPGADFGAVVVELVLANLLHCFEWSLPDGKMPEDVDMEEAPGLTRHKKVPLCIIAMPKKYC